MVMSSAFNRRRRGVPKIATLPVEERDKQNAIDAARMRARNIARYSQDAGERKAWELAVAGHGWEDVMGDPRWPRVTRSFARLLVLGVP